MRGKNLKFKKNIGKLSYPLLIRNFKEMLKKYGFRIDKIDLNTHIDKDLIFSENWNNLKKSYPYLKKIDLYKKCENMVDIYD